MGDPSPRWCLLWRAGMRAATGIGAVTGTILVAVAFALLDASLPPPGHSWTAHFLNALLAGVLAVVGVYGLRFAWCLLSYRLRRRDGTWCMRAVIFGHGLNVWLENRPRVPPVSTTDLGLIECAVCTDDARTATVRAFQPGGTPSVMEAQPKLAIARSYDVRWYATWHGHRYEVCRGTFAVHPGGTLAVLVEPEGHSCFVGAGPPGR